MSDFEPGREPVFDRYAEHYGPALARGLGVAGESQEFFAEGRIAWLRRRLAGLGVRPRRVADFGCGVGDSIPILRRVLGAEWLLGVDISQASLDLARSRHADADARFTLPEELDGERELDLIYTNGVFHHIAPEARPAAVERLVRALRPGGVLSFWENNPWSLGARLVMSRIPFDRGAKMVSASGARKLLRDCGLEIERTDFLFIFPRPLSRLRSLEPRLSRLPLGAQYQVLGRRV